VKCGQSFWVISSTWSWYSAVDYPAGLGRYWCLARDVTCVSHATWPRLPLLPTVNGSQLTRPRAFIVRYGGETFSAPVQNLVAQWMCPGTWTDQIVPGTRWYVILRYEGRGYGVLRSHDESQITVVWDVMRCGLVNGPPSHWYLSAKLQGITYHNLRHLRQI
jgi:hypothetical protein